MRPFTLLYDLRQVKSWQQVKQIDVKHRYVNIPSARQFSCVLFNQLETVYAVLYNWLIDILAPSVEKKAAYFAVCLRCDNLRL